MAPNIKVKVLSFPVNFLEIDSVLLPYVISFVWQSVSLTVFILFLYFKAVALFINLFLCSSLKQYHISLKMAIMMSDTYVVLNKEFIPFSWSIHPTTKNLRSGNYSNINWWTKNFCPWAGIELRRWCMTFLE